MKSDLYEIKTFSLTPDSLPPWPACLLSKPQPVSLMLSSLCYSVSGCLHVTGWMPRSCGPQRLGIISAQCNNCAALGWGLLWREPGPARPRGSPFVVGALVLITSVISTVFIGSPSLLQAWSPCSLLQALLCWGFSKLPSCRLRQTWLSGWAVTFVTGLLKMQLVSLIGCSVLSRRLRLLMATTNCLFFAKVSGMMLLRSLPREGWIVSVIDPGSSMAAVLLGHS